MLLERALARGMLALGLFLVFVFLLISVINGVVGGSGERKNGLRKDGLGCDTAFEVGVDHALSPLLL
jgi:hypothetical protein